MLLESLWLLDLHALMLWRMTEPWMALARMLLLLALIEELAHRGLMWCELLFVFQF
jgi:hypothetical protein